MSEQYLDVTVTVTNPKHPDVGTDVDMIEAQFTPKGRFSFKRHYNCAICGLTYRADKVVLRGGTPYCIPLKHYRDIPNG